MAQSKLARLVLLLSAKTERDELQWEPTAEDTVFQASFPHYSVQIRVVDRFVSEGAPNDVLITIRNKEGRMIDHVADPELLGELPDAYKIMTKIYEKARRRALGVDKALDELLRELGEDDPLLK